MSFLGNVANGDILVYHSKMMIHISFLILLFLTHRSFSNVKEKRNTITILRLDRYAFEKAHPPSNVTWPTLEMPISRLSWLSPKSK